MDCHSQECEVQWTMNIDSGAGEWLVNEAPLFPVSYT